MQATLLYYSERSLPLRKLAFIHHSVYSLLIEKELLLKTRTFYHAYSTCMQYSTVCGCVSPHILLVISVCVCDRLKLFTFQQVLLPNRLFISALQITHICVSKTYECL